MERIMENSFVQISLPLWRIPTHQKGMVGIVEIKTLDGEG
jgi:hypothetical protein